MYTYMSSFIYMLKWMEYIINGILINSICLAHGRYVFKKLYILIKMIFVIKMIFIN